MRAPGNTVATIFPRCPGSPLHPQGPLWGIRLYGYWECYHHHPVRGTGKIDFRVAAKPDDELWKFQTDRKFAFVSKNLCTLLVFETVVVWLRKMDFSILRASAHIPLYGCCTGATRVYGCYTGRAVPKSTFVSPRSQTTSYQNSKQTESLLLCLRNFLCF